MSYQGSFLRGDGLSWIGSTLFFHCLYRLGLRADHYYLPKGLIVSAADLLYYTQHLRTELAQRERIKDLEALDYVLSVSAILQGWAQAGHSIEVV